MDDWIDRIPSAYRDGYAKARAVNPTLARSYVQHTRIGDPLADAAVAALAHLDQSQVHQLLHAGMENQLDAVAAPPELHTLFTAVSTPPDWHNPDSCYPGYRLFHRHAALFLAAFVADVIVRGFATTISKSFLTTGRLTEYGIRRLRQNIRHLLEIMLPNGLDRFGDGWKLTLRIRLVHAQVRRQLLESPDWDAAAYGMPLHSAHIAFSSAGFSAMLLRGAKNLGASMNPAERAGFMNTWRYTAWLMGVPEPVLFQDESSALEFFRIGALCEPPPDWEAILMANALVNSAPRVIGIADTAERDAMAQYVYRISRALIGNELADQLRFPRQRTRGLLYGIRLSRRCRAALSRLIPGRADQLQADQFTRLLNAAALEESGISYRLPDQLYADQANPW